MKKLPTVPSVGAHLHPETKGSQHLMLERDVGEEGEPSYILPDDVFLKQRPFSSPINYLIP